MSQQDSKLPRARLDSRAAIRNPSNPLRSAVTDRFPWVMIRAIRGSLDPGRALQYDQGRGFSYSPGQVARSSHASILLLFPHIVAVAFRDPPFEFKQ